MLATIPDGEAQKMTGSKSEAFRGSVSTDAYFEMLSDRADDGKEISLVSDSLRSRPSAAVPPTSSGSAGSSVERVFGVAPSSSEDVPVRRSSGVARGGSASRPLSQEERLEYDRQRVEMVRDVLKGGGMPDQVGHDGEAVGHDRRQGGNGETRVGQDAEQEILRFAQNDTDGIITSLDDDFTDAAVQYEGAKRPFKCMFVRDERLRSGQRVTLRLLEDYVDDGVRIPANTHLSAICKIGDRLELQVRSLEMNGRIVPLALDAFDRDGLQGIYCPETTSARASRQASQDAISTAGTTFGGLVGDLASTVLRTGASIARSATGELSVSVVSGYEFYLVKSERK
ncbi:MAG: conjugative transposon protein TraM [Bacteroidales bacterium]|nr:conjugative transposon protein TraM [Bacteroidales bacterium]